MQVFPNRVNSPYTASSLKTLWQRCITDATAAGVIAAGDRFTFHDLRAYYATVHKQLRGVLPDLHKNHQTTARVYDRNKEVKRSGL